MARMFWRQGKEALPNRRSMSARQRRAHPRPRAATGTTASNAQISGTVGSWGPKVHKCDRKHAKCRPARHHQRARPSAKILVKWLAQSLCPWNPRQKISLAAASAEPNTARTDFAAPSADLPKTADLDAREPPTDGAERRHAQEETPLIWPAHTEAEHARLPDPVRESTPGTLFLLGALAIVLQCAGAIFKAARQHTRSSRRNGGVVPRRPQLIWPSWAGPDEVARRAASGARRRPRSVHPTHDVKSSLRKIMDELQRVAA